MNVTRQDLIQQLVDKYGYTKKSATNLVDDFSEIIVDNLQEGNTVSLRNFGVFDIIQRAARSCPNPQNMDEMCDIPAHWVPKFYPSKKMKAAVKIWQDNEKRGLA